MNYFYFFFFLSLAIIILIKPFTQFISAWVMRSERLTVTGLLTGSLGLLCIYISLIDPFWFERMWMIVTFVLGILLLMRGFFIIFFLGVIKKMLPSFMKNYYKFSIPISMLMVFLAFMIVSTDYVGPQKDISSCESDDQIQVICDFINSEEISAGSPDNKFTTPGGTPASLQISTSSITLPGVITSGFTITEHPAAKAVEIFLEAKTIGKFQGTKAATTPTG